ncbi:MAG TPA: hypothetical protein VNX18_03670 [Bryobacteraceae bacterium]|jgi:hypothetical protein|nr:hypothetical protein [Bryobacteraceae bacterium]
MKNIVAFFICCWFAVAQDSEFLIHHTFEAGLSGWDTPNGARVRTAASEGQHSLVFDYDLSSGNLSFLGLETKKGIPGFARMRFRVKVDYDTSLIVGITEPKPALGRSAFVSVRGGVWEQFDLKLSDFGPSDNPADPLDVGLPVDLDRVQGFGISDVAYTFRNPANSMASLFGIEAPSGKHTLLLQDFQVLKGTAEPTKIGSVTVDRFDRGMLQWILFGKGHFTLMESSPLNEPAVEVVAKTEHMGQPVALYRRMTNFGLDGTDGIEFDVASADPSAIVVSLGVRTPEGMRNDLGTTPIPVIGGRTPAHIKLPYERFAAGKEIRIIPSAIVTLTIARVGLKAGENAFWIGNVQAFQNPPVKR